jgi:ribosomal protein L11 methyltransferase
MLDLFPDGFEEVDAADGIEFVAYTDPGGEERVWRAFGAAIGVDVAPGWEERWRDFHQPVRVGEIWIGPPWEDMPTDGIAVVIDPGRAFGTGAHPTTRLTLQLLEGLPRGSLLDVGCGSGVLSIAAAKLGFGPIVAIDADEQAIDAVRRNADANGVEIEARLGDALTVRLPSADICVANVTRALVEGVAPRLQVTSLVASGYLVTEPATLRGWQHVQRAVEDGWAADAFERSAQ